MDPEVQKAFNELKTEVKKDLKNLQTNVSKDVDGIINVVGVPVGYLTVASVFLNVILLITIAVTASKSLSKKNDTKPPEKSIIIAHGYSRPAPKSLEERCKPEYENFMREFNDFQRKLATMSPPDKHKAEMTFQKNHKIRTFKCGNVSARLRDPVPPPVFAYDKPPEAIFWAYELPLGYYAVVPNVKNYSDNYHYERAMGNVFDSNFIQGKAYNHISVESPAVFECDGLSLRLLKKGVLRLSR